MPSLQADDLHVRSELNSKALLQPVLGVEPGDVLLFSGAHLHGSALNGSGATRFSTETRLVFAHDSAAGLGAPLVDGDTDGPVQHMWFRPVFADDENQTR